MPFRTNVRNLILEKSRSTRKSLTKLIIISKYPDKLLNIIVLWPCFLNPKEREFMNRPINSEPRRLTQDRGVYYFSRGSDADKGSPLHNVISRSISDEKSDAKHRPEKSEGSLA